MHDFRIRLAMFVVVTALAGVSSPVAQGAPGARYAPGPLRDTMPLDRGWRFLRADVSSAQTPGFDDAGWRAVGLPHTWNALDGQDGGDQYYRGIGWYRRHIVVPAGWVGRRLWLEFDGANSTTKAWVNGAQVGEHEGGYARFRFDVTEALRPGQDNVLAVSVSNAANADVPPLSGDFTMGGGLYRDVRLIATDPIHVDMSDYGGPGIVLRTRRLAPAEAHVDAIVQLSDDTAVDRNAMVRTIVTDARQRPVAWSSWTATRVPAHGKMTAIQSVVIPQPRLWDGLDDPYMYRALVEVADADTGRIVDSISQPLGLRTVRIDANTGLWLNGRHVRLQGVNMHQDRQDKGWAVSYADHVHDFALMRDMGVNAIRTAHYQHAPSVYDLADHGGFLVWTEIPLVNRTTSSPAFAANIEQQTREMVRQNINHPSVVTWGMGNELWSDDISTSTLVGALAASAKSDDPTRSTSYASCCIRDSGAVNATTDLNGYNKYFGWYYGTFADFGKWADDLHASDVNRRIAVSEYGASGSIGQHTDDMTNPVPSSTWHPEEYQSLLHEVYWKAIETRPFLWGTFVWCMFDFASDSRSDGAIPGRNDKGMVSYDRKVLKDAYYWYQANWTKRPMLHLNSKGWTRRTLASTNVKVYTNTDQVTLFVNGVPVGLPQSGADRVVVWPNVTLQPGPNRITVVGETLSGAAPKASLSDSATWTFVP